MKFDISAKGDNRKMLFGVSLEKEEGEIGFFDAIEQRAQQKLLSEIEDNSDIIDQVEDEV